MTAEEIKADMRRYADANFPAGWEAVSIMVKPGKPGVPSEVLVVLPDDEPPTRPRLP